MKAATSFLLIVNFILLSSWTVPPSMGYGPTPLSKPTAYKAETASYLGPLRLSSPPTPKGVVSYARVGMGIASVYVPHTPRADEEA